MQKNSNLIFILLALGLFVGWQLLGAYLWPQKPPRPADEPPVAQADDKQGEKKDGAAAKPVVKAPDAGKALAPAPADEPGDDTPVVLGGDNWHLDVTLTPRGAGVRRLVLNDFQQARADGQPEWLDEKKKIKKPLELIPEDKNRDVASFLFYHYPNPTYEDYPLDTLGRRVWKRVEPAEVRPGEKVGRASFETTVRGVRVTKTFTLRPRDYHLGLEVKMELVDPKATEPREFRYQMTGAHGLPIEGQFYTNTTRNALVAGVTGANEVKRVLQDQRAIAAKAGGDEVLKGDQSIRYAGSTVQYFASILAVDPRGQDDLDFLAQARPVVVTSAFRGRVLNTPLTSGEILLLDDADKKTQRKFALRHFDRDRAAPLLAQGAEAVVVSRPEVDLAGAITQVVVDVLDPEHNIPIFQDDITVAVSTAHEKGKVLRLKPGEPVVHKYVLYNGPVKVKLLEQLRLDEAVDDRAQGAPAVDDDLVAFYRDDLHLSTLTDYPSSWFGQTFAAIGLTGLVIWLTNVLHTVLWSMHHVIPAYGVCIILLTVTVRALMHPFSRKQAKMTMKMQELAPELKKLQEKYKNDKPALGAAQMELYRKHGANPLGSCWIVFLQMPVFLALYCTLQESIHFRLAPFLWIDNLAAPDMLVRWGESIPWLSRAQDYGWMLYLGPYFNLLPVIAAGLMIAQQKLTMPPPADEQQAMQMKMMKYMMVFMGLMFYKVAAGLAIYFIASSAWGFAERKLLPKKKPGDATMPPAETKPTLVQKLLQRLETTRREALGDAGAVAATNGSAAQAPASQQAGIGRGGKKKRRPGSPAAAPEEPTGWWAETTAKFRGWWAEVLRQAEKR